jgi:hypothetical protein
MKSELIKTEIIVILIHETRQHLKNRKFVCLSKYNTVIPRFWQLVGAAKTCCQNPTMRKNSGVPKWTDRDRTETEPRQNQDRTETRKDQFHVLGNSS